MSECVSCGGRAEEGQELCPICQKWEEYERMRQLADWGDGSISDDEEMRKAALDHRGCP